MTHDSPFIQSKFEHDGNHLYFLPKHLLRQLEVERPVYMVGTQGTGKTTLLQALNWRERLENQFLRQQLPKDPFAGRYIGLYLPLPRIQLQAMHEWLSPGARSLYETILALYLDLNWLQLLAEGISELLARDVIHAETTDEHRTVMDILDRIPALRQYAPARGPLTVSDLEDVFRGMRTALERLALLKQPASEQSLQDVPLGKAGELGRMASARLAALCNSAIPKEEKQWHFRICMDEAEHLVDIQLLVLNTIVRLSVWPAFPVVSFVRLPDHPTQTLLPRLALQSPNRELILLDEMGDKQFRDLVEGIATVRIRAMLRDKHLHFDTAAILGSLDINGLLEPLLKQSASGAAHRLLERADALARQPLFAADGATDALPKEKRAQHRAAPIYQAYLVEHLGITPPEPGDARWKRRKQESAELRKRMVAAFLSLCKEFKWEVPYASADMLLQMSDRCVRDFLRQMDAIYARVGQPPREFLASSVPPMVQAEALREASCKKRDLLRKQVVRSPAETERLVDGLARITAFIQSHGGKQGKHLTSNERGCFHLRVGKGDQGARVLELIREAGDCAYLRLLCCEGPEWVFQVHTSLAAAYEFSYRGPQYPTRLSLDDIHRFTQVEEENKASIAIQEIAERLAGQDPAVGGDEGPTLFDAVLG